MDRDTEEIFFPQESPLESCFAPKPVSSVVLKGFAKTVRNSENPDNEASIDLPLNIKENCTVDLGLEIECHSEPLITRRTHPKSGLVSNPASSTDNSTLPDGAIAVSPPKKIASLQRLQWNSPSTLASMVSSNCAKNIQGNRENDATKMVPLRIKGESNAPTLMFPLDKLATLKESQEKGVVCTVQLAQQKSINLPTSSQKLPRPIPIPSLYLRAPTSAPISSAKSTITTLQPIGFVPNQSMPLPIFTTNGLLPGSQHSIVTSLNNSSPNNLVFTSSPFNTSTNTRVTNILPLSVALQKTSTGYQVLGSPANTSIPVPSLPPISNSIPTKTNNPILLSGSTVRTMSPTTSANSTASVTRVTWPTVTGSTSEVSSLKPTSRTYANLKCLMDKKLSPTPAKPIAPKAVRTTMTMSKKTKRKLSPLPILTREVVARMVQPDGSMILMKKTILCPADPNNKQVNSNSFIVSEVSNDPSETGVAKKIVVCPTGAVPVSTAPQFTSSVNSSLNISNYTSVCGEKGETRISCDTETPFQWHQPYFGESPSSEVGAVSRDSHTAADTTACLSNEDDYINHEISRASVAYTKKNPDISAETISCVEHTHDIKIPMSNSPSSIEGPFQWHHPCTVSSTDLDFNDESNILHESHKDRNHEITPSSVGTGSLETHAPPRLFKLVQNRQFSEAPNKKRENRDLSVNHPPTKKKKNLEVKKACFNNNSVPTSPSQPFGLVTSTRDLTSSLAHKQMEDQLDGMGDCEASLHETALQWHHPCADPLEHTEAESMMTEEPDVTPELENLLPGTHKMVSLPITSLSSITINLSSNISQNISSSGQKEIPKYEVVDELDQKDKKIGTKERIKSPQTGNTDGVSIPGARNSGPGSGLFKWRNPSVSVPSSTYAGCTDAQIKPVSSEIPGYSELESAVDRIPGDYSSEEPVLQPDDDDDEIPSPRSTGSTEVKPLSQDDSYFPQPMAEGIFIRNDLDIPIIDRGSSHRSSETVLQGRHPSKNAESTVRTRRLLSDSQISQAPSTSHSSMRNQVNPEMKIAIQSLPRNSDVLNLATESATQNSSEDPINEEPVLLSDSDDDADDDDDYHCAIPSPGSTEEKPAGGPDDSYSSQRTAESIFIKNDLDIPIIDHGSIHSPCGTALHWRNRTKHTESAVKTESLSESECNQTPSASPSFMRNQENAVYSKEKYTPHSELEVLDHRTEKDTHKIDLDTVGSTATDSRASRNPSSSTAYPNAMLKWNHDRIHKIQLNLKRRMKMREQGQTNLWPRLKRQILGGKGTQPKKSQKLNDNSNLTTDSKQRGDDDGDDCPSSRGCKMQKDSPIGEVVSNVLQDCIMRKTIQDCYSKKLIPSIQMIHDACCNSGLDFSKETLEPCLNSIGFNWVNCHSGRLLVEDPRFTTKRIEYLDQLELYSDKNLVYLFVSDLVARTAGWQTYPYNAKEYLVSRSVAPYVVMHAMNKTRLVDGSLLVLKLDQYGVNTNRIGYWLKNIVLSKLPKGSVVILEDGIFELTVQPVERPHMGHSKAKIISWLKSHKVSSVNPDLPKAMLLSKAYDAVVRKTSIFDQTIQQCGFENLYLPKHHKDLNPIEFLWQDILDKLNKTPDVKYSSSFEDFVEQEFFSCSQEVTSVAYHLVRKFEATYRDFDFRFDELFDSMMSIVGPVDDEIPNEPTAKAPKTAKPVIDPNMILTCPVCRKPAKLTGFRCFKCKSFWKNLIRNYKKGAIRTLPVCKMYAHVSTRPPTCNGCRRNQYELALLKTYPNQALPLPPVTYKGEKHSHTLPFKTYPEISEDLSVRSDKEYEDSV